MDLNSKGIAWVGNIYQKFEAMCMEVDDIVRQDTLKYVENQIQTVGNNVKQFCSEFIEDVLPPSSGKDTDLKVHENLKERTDENPEKELCKENSKGGLTVEYHIGTVGNNLKQLRLQFREDSIEGTDENPKQGLYDEDSNEDLRETTIENSKKGATESPADKQSQSTISEIGAISDDNSSMTSGVHFITREDSNSVEESCIVNDLNQSCELKVSSHGPSSPFGDNCSEESNDTQAADVTLTEFPRKGIDLNSPSVNNEAVLCFSETEEPVESSDEEAEESDADEQSMETIPLFDKAKLEESCIMVDSNELRFISCHPAKYKSYKRRIREAFASKRRLVKDYEQLATWHLDLDEVIDQQQERRRSTVPSALVRKSGSSDNVFSESEWEII